MMPIPSVLNIMFANWRIKRNDMNTIHRVTVTLVVMASLPPCAHQLPSKPTCCLREKPSSITMTIVSDSSIAGTKDG